MWPFLTVTLRVSSRDSRVALPDSDSGSVVEILVWPFLTVTQGQ